MRILVLGGTSFLSKEVARVGLLRGHDVTCAARGKSGTPPEGARFLQLDRDDPTALEPLAGERFDAVVDVATMATAWVNDALRVLGARAAHWTYTSSINVYADLSTMHQTTKAATLTPIPESERTELDEVTPAYYGGVEMASENAVREAMGDRAFVVRPGQITGPGDYMDRFGYWPARFSRGGRVAVPDNPGQPIQHIDVRDLAEWIVFAGEQRLSGTYDAVGPALELGSVLREMAELTAPEGTELVPISPEKLTESAVNPWMGPKSMPLWAPETHYGFTSHDATSAWKAGLRLRPLSATVLSALADERERGLDRERKAGLTPAEEAELLG